MLKFLPLLRTGSLGILWVRYKSSAHPRCSVFRSTSYPLKMGFPMSVHSLLTASLGKTRPPVNNFILLVSMQFEFQLVHFENNCFWLKLFECIQSNVHPIDVDRGKPNAFLLYSFKFFHHFSLCFWLIFKGTGKSKKLAKRQAAHRLLQKLKNSQPDNPQE